MLFHAILPSASTLLLIASQFSQTFGAALSEEHVHMMNRRDWYNSMTGGALDFHKNKGREFDEFVAKEKLRKRQDYDWHPAYTYASNWGYHSFWASKSCDNTNRKSWYYGTLVRTITYGERPSQNVREMAWWQNMTWYTNTVPSGTSQCYRWGQPTWNYHSSTGNSQQCKDKIYNPATQAWTERSSSNTNVGWTSNNVTYGSQTVRTIWDCLLNRTAVEYQNNHPHIGFKPVRYILDGMTFYRFYDSNNFAWFLGCPDEWSLREVKRNRLQKRDCFLCWNNNPIWDFLPDNLHNPLADSTPLEWYSGDINNYNVDRINTINFWPPRNNRNTTIEGRKCTQLAVSRPGLRHWTAKFFDDNDLQLGWVKKNTEWNYPGPWLDIEGERKANGLSTN
ncbi:hypothetical protein TWF106_011391 [Orbilia oligospora]|uniref:Uncharacterized protein n=1 Tax=Orbilia oligospora TaxID=2813651 RepID=A0A6G1LRK1_ORBOL|nr:hypothetical protein TWF788_010289 [Orbilia oligospora]KAF3197976.1 hypothetical protein TWF679_002470 [Orbilia oligospora]KAF3208494.1 hypothetical protein TWF106_011391 [Orbilia oligospora]KAF3230723.1 hypothetical protein TWF192_004358 [Orbilia oligospora]